MTFRRLSRPSSATPASDRDRGEQPLQRVFGKQVGGEAAEQAAGNRRHLENHAEAQVDQLRAAARGRHRTRRRDHGRQADRRRRPELEPKGEMEQRDEEHAAADAEQGAHAACGHARAEHDTGEGKRERRHRGDVEYIGRDYPGGKGRSGGTGGKESTST